MTPFIILMSKAKQAAVQNRAYELAQIRFKERLLAYVRDVLKSSDEAVVISEAASYLKHKTHEYERRDINGIERQVQSVLDQVYSQQSGLNI